MHLSEQLLEKLYDDTFGLPASWAIRRRKKDDGFLSEIHFNHILRVEKMRTERSRRPFLLLLLNISNLMMKPHEQKNLESIKIALITSLRETDIRGWYHNGQCIGIIFPEVAEQSDTFSDFIIQKIFQSFCEKLDPEWINEIAFSFIFYPEVHSTSWNRKIFHFAAGGRGPSAGPEQVAVTFGKV